MQHVKVYKEHNRECRSGFGNINLRRKVGIAKDRIRGIHDVCGMFELANRKNERFNNRVLVINNVRWQIRKKSQRSTLPAKRKYTIINF